MAMSTECDAFVEELLVRLGPEFAERADYILNLVYLHGLYDGTTVAVEKFHKDIIERYRYAYKGERG